MTDNKSSEIKIIKKISFVGIFGNVILCAFKLIAGILGKSAAMISDAIHSLSDVFGTFIAFLGAKFAKVEADKEHPYGHDKIECVAAFILGIILLVTGILIGSEGIKIIISKNYTITPSKIALIAAIVSIFTKEAMYHYTKHQAKIINSEVFMADAWHHRTDAISSIGTLIAITGARMGLKFLDPLASVLICLFIIKISYNILKDAFNKIIDTSCDDNFVETIKGFISKQEGVICVDMLNTRMFGNKVYIDLEIQVNCDISLKEAHQIAENVHSNVESNFQNIKHIMIHVNPCEKKDLVNCK